MVSEWRDLSFLLVLFWLTRLFFCLGIMKSVCKKLGCRPLVSSLNLVSKLSKLIKSISWGRPEESWRLDHSLTHSFAAGSNYIPLLFYSKLSHCLFASQQKQFQISFSQCKQTNERTHSLISWFLDCSALFCSTICALISLRTFSNRLSKVLS